jgi:hypothetical protein
MTKLRRVEAGALAKAPRRICGIDGWTTADILSHRRNGTAAAHFFLRIGIPMPISYTGVTARFTGWICGFQYRPAGKCTELPAISGVERHLQGPGRPADHLEEPAAQRLM